MVHLLGVRSGMRGLWSCRGSGEGTSGRRLNCQSGLKPLNIYFCLLGSLDKLFTWSLVTL